MAVREMAEMAKRLAGLELRVSGMLQHGRVVEVDTERQRVRLDFGPATDAGNEHKSPWVPYAQFAGKLKIHTPPTVGQQFTVVSPAGTTQGAVALPLTWSDAFPSPSAAPDQNIVTYGNVTITVMDDLTRIDVGGATIEVTSEHIFQSIKDSRIEMDEDGIRLKVGKKTTVTLTDDGFRVDALRVDLS